MDRKAISEQVNAFSRFWEWRTQAKAIRRRWFAPKPCYCIWPRDIDNDWTCCDEHKKQFGFDEALFESLLRSEIDLSPSGRERIVDLVYKRQKIYVRQGATIEEICELAGREFPQESKNSVRLNTSSYANHWGYGYGTSASSAYLSLKSDVT